MNFAFDGNIDLHFWLISIACNTFYIKERILYYEIDDVSDTNNATSEPETSSNQEEGNNDKTGEKCT